MVSPRLIFVHGAAADARLWSPVIDKLPPEWDAQAITLTYFGKTEWPDDGSQFGTRLHAQELRHMAAEMGGDVDIVCWSYSVHVGLQALLDAPGLFRSALFYEAALPHYLSEENEREVFGKDFGSCFGAVGAKLEKEGNEAAVRQLVGSGFGSLPQDRQDMYLSNARMMPLLMGGGEAPTKIGPEELARIETPTLVAMGGKTRPCFELPSRALASHLPNATLDIVANADHFLPETNAELFAAVVEEWIDGEASGQ